MRGNGAPCRICNGDNSISNRLSQLTFRAGAFCSDSSSCRSYSWMVCIKIATVPYQSKRTKDGRHTIPNSCSVPACISFDVNEDRLQTITKWTPTRKFISEHLTRFSGCVLNYFTSLIIVRIYLVGGVVVDCRGCFFFALSNCIHEQVHYGGVNAPRLNYISSEPCKSPGTGLKMI